MNWGVEGKWYADMKVGDGGEYSSGHLAISFVIGPCLQITIAKVNTGMFPSDESLAQSPVHFFHPPIYASCPIAIFHLDLICLPLFLTMVTITL